MWIENLTDKSFVIYITLSREPELRRELEIINEIVYGRDDCNVIISLANIEVLASSSITKLVMLHNSLNKNGRSLILCRVGLPTKGIFATAGLISLFNFVNDVSDALATIQHSGHTHSIAENVV
ncbi:MAG: STAS domain-containing protein [Phycisphaerae bacterium]|nr:STAS domain-containing protein [Phycisphaerae bacterium]